MKKITLIVLAASIGLAMSAKAQIQRGNVFVGGDFADISLGLNKGSAFNINISPKAAWFIQDNVALGGYVNLGLQTASNVNTSTQYGFGALGRYYSQSDVDAVKHGRLFGEATVGIGGQNISGGVSTNGLDFSFGPGFAYFVTPNIGLETLVKYGATAGFGNLGFSSKLSLNFGLQIYLPGASTARKVKGDMK